MILQKDKKTNEAIVCDGHGKELFRHSEAFVAIQWAINHTRKPIIFKDGGFVLHGSLIGKSNKAYFSMLRRPKTQDSKRTCSNRSRHNRSLCIITKSTEILNPRQHNRKFLGRLGD